MGQTAITDILVRHTEKDRYNLCVDSMDVYALSEFNHEETMKLVQYEGLQN